MMMDWPTLVESYDLGEHVTGVIHCGAHLVEEAADYEWAFGETVPIWWIEGNPGVYRQIAARLSEYPNQYLIRALLAEVDDDLRLFHVTNYDGMSSSLLEFGTHPSFSPDTHWVGHYLLPTRTIDSLWLDYGMEDINMLVMDLQGAEALALAGARTLIDGLDFVMTEVNKAEVYQNCAKVEELDQILADFDRVETLWVADYGWGDALYRRRT